MPKTPDDFPGIRYENQLRLRHQTEEPTPEEGVGILYTKDVDGYKELFFKDADGNAAQVTIEGYLNADAIAHNTLDMCYDQGGTGAGRLITADSGPVRVDASGAASKEAIDLDGYMSLSASSDADILWSTDAAGDIGASGANRPDKIYVKSEVKIGAIPMQSSDVGTSIVIQGACTATNFYGSEIYAQPGGGGNSLNLSRLDNQGWGLGTVAQLRAGPADTETPLVIGHPSLVDGSSNKAIVSVWKKDSYATPQGKIHSFGYSDPSETFNEVAAIDGYGIRMIGSSDIKWATDGGGDIGGSSSSNRPNNIYAAGVVYGATIHAQSGGTSFFTMEAATRAYDWDVSGVDSTVNLYNKTDAPLGLIGTRTNTAGYVVCATNWYVGNDSPNAAKIHSFGFTDASLLYQEKAYIDATGKIDADGAIEAGTTVTAGGSMYTSANVFADGYMSLRESSDPDAVLNEGAVYTKDDSGDTELFYRDAAGNVIQITQDGYVGGQNTLDQAYDAGGSGSGRLIEADSGPIKIDASGAPSEEALRIDGYIAFESSDAAEIVGTVDDGASSKAVILNSENTLSTPGAKLLSVQNNGTEKAYVDKDGTIYAADEVQTGGDILIGGGTQDYKLSKTANTQLHVQSQAGGAGSYLVVTPLNEDGGDDAKIAMYGLGHPGAAREFLEVGYDTSDTRYEIHSHAVAGTIRDLAIYTGTNTDQLLVQSDGNVSIGGSSNFIWGTDGGGDIGGSADHRPDYVFVKSGISSAGTLECEGNFTLKQGQDYEFTSRASLTMAIQGKATGNLAFMELFTNDGDGTDQCRLILYGKGTPGDITTDMERLLIGWNGSSAYTITTTSAGSGSTQPLVLQTGSNSDQLRLKTDGDVSIGGSSNLIWGTDGGGDIGANGANRPDDIWAKSNIYAGSQVTASTIVSTGQISVSGTNYGPNLIYSDFNTGLGSMATMYSNRVADELALVHRTRTDGAGNIAIASVWDSGGASAPPAGKIHSFGWTDKSDTYNEVAYVDGYSLQAEKSLRVDSALDLGSDVTDPWNDGGLVLRNTTAAASGLPQFSPPIRWGGKCYHTGDTASRTIEWQAYVDTKSSNGDLGHLVFTHATDGAALEDVLAIQNNGYINILNASNLVWQTDGGGNIGSTSSLRPNNIYAKNDIWTGNDLKWSTDGGGDIGANGANRPQDIWASRHIYAGNQVTCNSLVSSGGTISVDGSNYGPNLIYNNYSTGLGTTANVLSNRAADELLFLHRARTDGADNIAMASVWDSGGASAPPQGRIHSFGWTDKGDTYNEIAAVDGYGISIYAANDIKWAVDGGGSIGTSTGARPENVYAYTTCYGHNLQVYDRTTGTSRLIIERGTRCYDYDVTGVDTSLNVFGQSDEPVVLLSNVVNNYPSKVVAATNWYVRADSPNTTCRIHSFGFTDASLYYQEMAYVTAGGSIRAVGAVRVGASNALVYRQTDLTNGIGTAGYADYEVNSQPMCLWHRNRTDGSGNKSIIVGWDARTDTPNDDHIVLSVQLTESTGDTVRDLVHFHANGDMVMKNGGEIIWDSAEEAEITGTVADGASAKAVILNSENSLSTAGAKLLSIENNGTEKAYVDKDGLYYSTQGVRIAGDAGSGVASTITLTNATASAGSNTPTFIATPAGVAAAQATWIKMYVGTTATWVMGWQ